MNVRIIAATNRDLKTEVEAGRFREDLYYRLNVMSIMLPPLREREDDVLLIVQNMLGTEWELDEEARAAILAYHWPGNVRQLINAIDRAMVLADDKVLTIDDLPREVAESLNSNGTWSAPTGSGDSASVSFQSKAEMPADDLASIERAHIVAVLRKEAGNKARAARALGIHRRKLYRLIERFQIDLDLTASPQ